MKKLSPIAYRALFFKHVWKFLGNVLKPYELKKSHVIAVSGGMDSMALLWVATTLKGQGKIGPVRALFIDHGTRIEQAQEEQVVRKFCQQEGIPFLTVKVHGLAGTRGNFENLARVQRQQIFSDEIRPGELLWQGHHLDDSYEWNLMQKFRSNNVKSSLGIPVRNGFIVRPFLCVSRAQIKRMVDFEGIPYLDDPTNLNTQHDRNYIRHKVVPPIRKRYPSYLKHYSHMANFGALMLKVSLFGASAAEIYAYEQGALLIGPHFTEIQIQEIIHTYSNTDRGEIIGPIQRMLRAIDNDKKGPFHFSGGMEAYYTTNMLMIYSQGMPNHDVNIATTLSQLSEEQLNAMPYYKRIECEHSWRHLLKSSDAMLNMPGLVLVLESDSICKTLNASVFDPLFPRVSQVCKARGIRFVSFLKCLETWDKKKEKLPERIRLLPLYNLSNLFTSQQ